MLFYLSERNWYWYNAEELQYMLCQNCVALWPLAGSTYCAITWKNSIIQGFIKFIDTVLGLSLKQLRPNSSAIFVSLVDLWNNYGQIQVYFLVLWRYKRGGVWLYGSLDLKERGNILKITLLIGLNKYINRQIFRNKL